MQGSSCSYRWWVHGSIIMPPLSPLQLFGGQQNCIKEESDCNELRKGNENNQVNLYTGGHGMERSVKLKLFHIYNHGVAQSCILHPNLSDAALCTRHMLLFFINKQILLLIQNTYINSNMEKKYFWQVHKDQIY